MQYTYDFKIDNTIIGKSISDNSNKDLLSTINYLLLSFKSSKEIYFNPNPKDKIYNCVLQYNFKEIPTQERVVLFLSLKNAYEKISNVNRLYLSTYQISLNNDLNIHIVVKLYNKPKDKDKVDPNLLKKKVSNLKKSYFNLLLKSVPELKGKITISNANLFGFTDLYPCLVENSALKTIFDKNPDNCIAYKPRIRDVIGYFDLKNVSSLDFVYNYNDVEVKRIYEIAYHWYVMIKRQIEDNYSCEFDLYFPLKDVKKDSKFILGLTIIPNNQVVLKKIENDFLLKKKLYNEIEYIPFLDLLSKISKNYKNKRIKYDIGYIDDILLGKDLKKIDRLISDYEKKYRLKNIINIFSKQIYCKCYPNTYLFYLPYYKNGVYSPIMFYKKRLYTALEIALKNRKDLIEITLPDITYIKDELNKRNLKGEIKVINNFYDYGYVNNFVYTKRSKGDTLVKYPSYIKDENNIELLNRYLNDISNIPILFWYHTLLKILLTQNNLYSSEMIITNCIDKELGINLIRQIYGILSINDLVNYYNVKLFRSMTENRDKNNIYFMNDTIFKHRDFKIIEHLIGGYFIRYKIKRKNKHVKEYAQTNFIITTATDNDSIRSKIISSKKDFTRYVYGFIYDNPIIDNRFSFTLKNQYKLTSILHFMMDNALKYMKKNNIGYFNFLSLKRYLVKEYKLDDNFFFSKWEAYNGTD